MKNVIVIGSSGQLGTQFSKIADEFSDYCFFFYNKKVLDITNGSQLNKTINDINPYAIINCSGFTKVDLCEKKYEYAKKVNGFSLINLVNHCKKKSIKLVHFSTDYVFDGKSEIPYTELDCPNPINAYGKTKLIGEKIIRDSGVKNSLIIRTSWLYSYYKKNFVKTIIHKLNNEQSISVVDNQIGSPTNAEDLSYSVLNILNKIKNDNVEIYNYSNSGSCSWFDFAKQIAIYFNKDELIIPINPTTNNVVRPLYTVLNTTMFSENFKIKLPNWKTSLNNHLTKYYSEI